MLGQLKSLSSFEVQSVLHFGTLSRVWALVKYQDEWLHCNVHNPLMFWSNWQIMIAVSLILRIHKVKQEESENGYFNPARGQFHTLLHDSTEQWENNGLGRLGEVQSQKIFVSVTEENNTSLYLMCIFISFYVLLLIYCITEGISFTPAYLFEHLSSLLLCRLSLYL